MKYLIILIIFSAIHNLLKIFIQQNSTINFLLRDITLHLITDFKKTISINHSTILCRLNLMQLSPKDHMVTSILII